MVEFLVKHKLINTTQHRFLKARSCLTNLLCFLEEITKWIDDRSPVDVVYLDFQKAFDKVPVLGRTTQEKDLGVTFSADMKVSEQCGIAASKGNQILGLIRRTIRYNEKLLIVPLYKAIVRPHLEYCIQAWRPYRKKDIDKLERIKRRATKMILLT